MYGIFVTANISGYMALEKVLWLTTTSGNVPEAAVFCIY